MIPLHITIIATTTPVQLYNNIYVKINNNTRTIGAGHGELFSANRNSLELYRNCTGIVQELTGIVHEFTGIQEILVCPKKFTVSQIFSLLFNFYSFLKELNT